ncbi:MAG: sigma-70 family RNA polymerase sigma factor [Planctomycetota bacterium]
MDEGTVPEFDITTMSQLVDAARDGDAAAHSEICRQVQGRLNRMANQHLDANLRRKLNPSDIVQATLTRMVQGFHDFRGTSSAEFYGWLNTILKNEVNSTRRNFQRQRRDIRREHEPGPESPADEAKPNEQTPDQLVERQELISRFNKVIQRLPPDYAHVIELRSIQELPFDEVAEQMGRSVNAVSKLWKRAIVVLQQELSNLDDSISL